MSGRRFAASVVAQLRMYMRRRVAVFWSLLFPIILMTLLGIIFGGSTKGGTVEIVDQAHTPSAAVLVRVLEHNRGLEVKTGADIAKAQAQVRSGDRDAAVWLRQGAGGQVRATLYYSNSSPETAGIIRGIVQGAADGVSVAMSGRPPAVALATRSVDSASLGYVQFLLPGVLAISVMISAVIGLATVLVNWRQRGILRRLKLTPMPLSEFLASRIVASLVVSVIQVAVLIAFGAIAFGIHISTTAWVSVPVALAGALCFLAMGMAVGSLVSAAETADAVTNVITNPMMFLSGTFIPVSSMPAVLQSVARVLPLYYLANGLRDTIVRGEGFGQVWTDIAILVGLAICLFAISVRTFRWEPSN